MLKLVSPDFAELDHSPNFAYVREGRQSCKVYIDLLLGYNASSPCVFA